MHLEQVSGYQAEIVDIEYNQKGERDEAAVTQILHPCDGEAAAAPHEEGETEYDSPTDDVYEDFDEPKSIVRYLFHRVQR